MKIFLVKQPEEVDWYVYDSMIVVADSAKEARSIHPAAFHEGAYFGDKQSDWEGGHDFGDWVPYIDRHKLLVEYHGESAGTVPQGTVLCSSCLGI